ncbi:MAG: NUDIX domain-containing protein [Bacteroidales bacterium]|nr:NUDIX domain-containing protein [Bacteroidales bacterium]
MNEEVLFSSNDDQPPHGFTYAIIGARYLGKWVFVYHNRRGNWGMPAGHVEAGETPDETAERELVEETGAVSYIIEPVATYTVIRDGAAGSGRLYYAIIRELGEIIDREEIGSIQFADQLPEDVAFPGVHRLLFNFLESYHLKRGDKE